MKNFYITTPIYYVNDVPHIGHVYTTIAADVISRWYRLHNRNVFFLTGTDEHGTKIVEAAKLKNKPVKEYVDEISDKFKTTWKKLNISYNHFIRTTDKYHEKTVQNILQKLYNNEYIYKAKYKGLYCIQCENFITETELINGLCPNHMTKPQEKSEENYFFKLSHFREKLIEIITDKNNENHFEICPEERKNEILGKLNTQISDISISRENLEWGIRIPFDIKQTTYVWIDALINYISAIGYEDSDLEFNFNELWPADLHLIGKDILWFHTVVWPALLLAINLPLPKKIFAHGYFTINGKKMSKTIGNVIYPDDMIHEFGVDGTRYLILSAFPFGADGDFSIDFLKTKYNNDLANNLGNLFSRVTKMIEKYNKSVIPQKGNNYQNLWSDLSKIDTVIEHLEFHNAIETIQKVISISNQYIDKQQPWNLAKQGINILNDILYNLYETLWVLAHYIYLFMPVTGQTIFYQLGQNKTIEQSFFLVDKKIQIEYGNKIKTSSPLFPRIQ